MVNFGKTEIKKENFYAVKEPMKIWDGNANKKVISKLFKTKPNSQYLNGYLDNVMTPLVLILPKMSLYDKAFRVKDGNKDKNNKLMFFHINDEKLLEKYKTIWTTIENLKNIELDALPVSDNRYI